jgi:hypothetical protein
VFPGQDWKQGLKKYELFAQPFPCHLLMFLHVVFSIVMQEYEKISRLIAEKTQDREAHDEDK